MFVFVILGYVNITLIVSLAIVKGLERKPYIKTMFPM